MTTTMATPVVETRSRAYGIGVAVVVGVHFVLWGIVMLGGWLYWDDFILQGQAARLGLTSDLLLNNHDGHVMPATYLVVWLIQEAAGLNYALVAGTMLLGEVALVVAAVLAFTTLLGRRVETVVAVAVLLLAPIMMPALTWWAAALTIVPLATCALFATVTHVRYLQTGSRAALVSTFILVAVALSFFEKSLLIPGWLFLVTVLVDPSPGVWAAARAVVIRRWRLWVGWAVFVVIYLAAFAQVAEGRTRLPTGPGQVFDLLVSAIFKTIAPALIGGPLRWTAVDFSASFADPPAFMIGIGALVLLVVIYAGVRGPGPARKAWVVAGVYLLADLASFAVGRLGEGSDPGVVQAGRYVATSMIPISIAIGATIAGQRARLTRPAWRWPLVAGVSAIALAMLISTLSYAAIWSKNPAETWVGNARSDLAAAEPGVPLLDQDVPDFLLLPVTHPYNQASWFLAPLRERPGFASSTSALQLLDNRGYLVAAQVDGAAALPAAEGCHLVEAGSEVTIPLEHALIPWLHTVALDYRAAGPGLVSVAIGSGEPVTTEVSAGENSVYVRAEGGESSITLGAVDTTVCISAAEVGKVIPRDLNYGGGVDLTDQLQGLD
ncbi:MAG: hypothetical protein KDC08_02810 [Actinobacteria bacterium]|nr:hypothetical protein [Actinomycetota bacterium]